MKNNYSFNPDTTWDSGALAQLQQAVSLVSDIPSHLLENGHTLAAILDHMHVDHDLVIAGFLFETLQADADKRTVVNDQLSEGIASLYAEACDLNEKEALWLKDKQPSDGGHQMMLLSMMKDVRLAFLLLAHHLLRMRQAKNETTETKQRLALQTRNLFAPLANRLGIGQLKWELEDLAFRYLQPEQYKAIAKALEERRDDRERYIKDVVGQLQYALESAGIPAAVYGRPKHIFSIWRKMQNKHLAFEDLYDVRALRVQVETVTQCYSALSVVHSVWSFVQGEYDDYIAAPKSNGYQSLHTAVIGPEGKTVEVQIRTKEMHEHAELGVAAHWRYKEGGGKRDENLEKRIESLRKVLSGEEGAEEELVDDTSEGHIYVLTPKGNVVELSAGATPLDFAYHVHTDVGHRCRGAKVDGHMVPLTTPLHSGQQVDVITAKNGTPSRDWLLPHAGYLKTSRARSKVRHWFKQQFRDEHISSGKAALAHVVSKEQLNNADWSALVERFNFKNVDDLYAAIGRGELGVHQVEHLIVEETQPEEEPEIQTFQAPKTTRTTKGVSVHGVGDLLTQMARCCKPMPGDDVVGFITRGRGVTVHRRDCANVKQMLHDHADRFIDVSWGEKAVQPYEVDMEIKAMDRSGLLRDITSVLAGEEVNVLGVNTHSNRKTQTAHMRLTVEVQSVEQLNHALSRLAQVQGMLEAHRVGK